VSKQVLYAILPANFVAAHEDTVCYSANSISHTPYSWWCLLPLLKNPNMLSASRPSALIFGHSGLIRQLLPTVFISPNV